MKKKLIKTIITAVCFLTLALGAVTTIQVEAKSISVKNPVITVQPMELPPSH
ncbi:MAG: hypothetical protein LKE46_13415 [Clostridium sp.]|jgi:hypothetical protein|uniref:hypothetical protein n=1 Tax=Clostridium sp. TaxID=1506 RepID=UPI0025C4E45E|nr:hypothetical protein [Clostridium sp.]MCH3965257.1 hypothetical protein [Clostridium sp.]MCI1714477.1 hypothetical protein [Clostridium sp.]MCI1798739.1 hypothetical protein [Clostridium sp.]MCI1812530.1 hypothetical protein [Clostridium sp.]MCI1869549.1 hypothetical protein [Clostridium sp.]